MNHHSSQITRGRKFEQVLQGARSVFMSDGFEGASVDDIAKAAGVSKATLYNYFPDKRQLFSEVVRTECDRQSEQAINAIDMQASPREVLGAVGRHFLRFITSPFGMQVFRICVGESARFPDLSRAFYQSGPARMRIEMGAYLTQAVARGELDIEDPEFAATQFGELCKAHIWTRLLFKVVDEVSAGDIDHVVDNAVEVFLARYGASG